MRSLYFVQKLSEKITLEQKALLILLFYYIYWLFFITIYIIYHFNRYVHETFSQQNLIEPLKYMFSCEKKILRQV